MSEDEIEVKIKDIFGDYEEFDDLGYEYVSWVIQQDLKDMKEEQYSKEQCLKEFADIMVNIIRKLNEEGYDYREIIKERLEDRMEGQSEDIIDEYTSKYQKEKVKNNE